MANCSPVPDNTPVQVRSALLMAIELVYETAACGLTINVKKCRLGPTTRIKYLGIIVDSLTRSFSLPAARVERLRLQIQELSALTRRSEYVPARTVAQLVGLLWACSPCCPRAVSIMARGLVAILAKAMRTSVWSVKTRGRGPGRRGL